MATEKEVVAPAAAVRKAAGPVAEVPVETVPPVVEAPKAAEPAKPVTKWKFVKNFGVADVLTFKDGTDFQFRAIQRNDGFGYMTNSFVVTEDKILADNLREFAKNRHSGVIEVPA